jgi:hypothetical protein
MFFWFFSVFNPDAIKDLNCTKEVFQLILVAFLLFWTFTKRRNSKGFHMNGGIGLISSRLLLEGPLVKTKVRFWWGKALWSFILKLSEEQKIILSIFYDLNAKLSYKLDPNNNLFLSGYFGRDVFSLNKSFTNIYGNSILNLRWNHLSQTIIFKSLPYLQWLLLWVGLGFCWF